MRLLHDDPGSLAKDDRGASAMEYGVLTGLIAVAIIAALSMLAARLTATLAILAAALT